MEDPEKTARDSVLLNDSPERILSVRGSRSDRLASFTKRLGRGLLPFALPAAGALVAGPLGVVAGSVASGAILYADNPEQPTKTRLKTALLGAFVSGVAASLPGLGGLAAQAVGIASKGACSSVLAGLGGVGLVGVAGANAAPELLKDRRFEIEHETFAKKYSERVAEKLETKGLAYEEPKLPGVFPLSREARDRQAKTAITMAAVQASHHLGPVIAIALASEVGHENFDDRQGQEFDGLALEGAKEFHKEDFEGIEVVRATGIDEGSRSPAFAGSEIVVIDKEAGAGMGEETFSFVVGHELSHVRHRDVAERLGTKAVLDSVEDTLKEVDDISELFTLGGTLQSLQKAANDRSQEVELRADAEGFAHAVTQGHDGEEVIAGFQGLMDSVPGESATVETTHPSDKRRLDALRKLL